MNSVCREHSQGESQRNLRLKACMVLWCLGGCSLQDFDRLHIGAPGSGGAAGEATQTSSGGAEAGAKSTDASGGMGVNPSSAGRGGGSGFGGAEPAGTAGAASGMVGIGANAGQVGLVGGSAGGGAGGAGAVGAAGNGATCVPGAAGCPSLTCAAGFKDCNNDMVSDGCETYLNGLTSCGTSCTNVVTCDPSQVCNSGVCGAVQGMAKFSVPLTTAGQIQRYGYKFAANTNLRNALLFIRLYSPGGQQGIVNMYPIDIDYTYSSGANVNVASIATGWYDASIPLGDIAGAYDPTSMYQLTIEIQAGTAGPWTNPTLVYIDGIWSSNGVVNESFNAAVNGVPNSMVESTMQKVDGSKMTWTDTLP